MRTILAVLNGPTAGQRMLVSPGEEISVGRTERAEWAIPYDRSMSSLHFLVQADASGAYITDLQSTNGTSLNAEPVTKRIALRHQDRIVAGETIFEVLVEETAPIAATPSSEASPRSTADLPDSSIFAVPKPAVPKPESADVEPAKRQQEELDPEVVAMLLGNTPEPAGASEPAGEPQHDVKPSDVEPQADARYQPDARPQTDGPGQAHFESEKCEAGLTLCRGNTGEIGSGEIAVQLANLYPAYVVIDFHKVSAVPPAELHTREYLFDWFEPDIAEAVSPQIITAADFPSWASLIEDHWGQDAVICLFSRRERDAFIQHLRHMCHPGSSDGEPPGGMVGYCWPSVLASLLSFAESDYVVEFLDGIDAVLVEFPDFPEAWQVFGGDQLVSDLTNLGLVERSTAIDSAAESE